MSMSKWMDVHVHVPAHVHVGASLPAHVPAYTHVHFCVDARAPVHAHAPDHDDCMLISC
jgi:hypothetical protein